MWLSEWFKKQDKANSGSPVRPGILAVSMFLSDRLMLERLAEEYDWELHLTNSPQEAFSLASRKHFEIILCDRNQPGYPWREVMDALAERSPRSRVLLVSPVSDDHLWSDVLRQGGYDILIRPLRQNAVLQLMNAVEGFPAPVAS